MTSQRKLIVGRLDEWYTVRLSGVIIAQVITVTQQLKLKMAE